MNKIFTKCVFSVLNYANYLFAGFDSPFVKVLTLFCSSIRTWNPKKKVDDLAASLFLTDRFCKAETVVMYHQDWLSAISLTTQDIRKGADEIPILTHLARVSDNLLDVVREIQMFVDSIVPDLPTLRHIRSKVDGLKVFSSKFLHDFERHRSIWVTMSSKVEDLDSAITDYYERVLERFEIRHMSAEDRAITSTTRLPPSSATSLEDSDAKNEVIPTERPATVEGTTKKLTWAEMEDTDDKDEESINSMIPTTEPETVEATTKRMSWADMVDSEEEDEYDDDENVQMIDELSAEKMMEVFDQQSITTTSEPMAEWKVVNNPKTRRKDRKYYK